MNSGIYLISATKGSKCYVGSSKDLKKRLTYHWGSLNRNKHENKRLQNYFNKYGISSIVFKILERCDPAILEDREIYYAQQLNPWFNIVKNIKRQQGDFKHTKKSRLKIKNASKNMWKQNREKMLSSLKQGEENGFSKLTNQQVENIKYKLLNPLYSINSISKEYNVSRTIIKDIKRGKWWRHILPELTEYIKNVKPIRSPKSSKVVSSDVVESIKLDIISNTFSLQELSDKYSVSCRNIQAIKSLQNYKNIREDLNEKVKESKLLRKNVQYNYSEQTMNTKKNNFLLRKKSIGKLNIDQINEIKEYRQKGYTNKELSEMYNVHPNTISYINTGRTFNWID